MGTNQTKEQVNEKLAKDEEKLQQEFELSKQALQDRLEINVVQTLLCTL